MNKAISFLLVISNICSSYAVARGNDIIDTQPKLRPLETIDTDEESLATAVENRLSQMNDEVTLAEAQTLIQAEFGDDVWTQISANPDFSNVKNRIFAKKWKSAKNLGDLRSDIRSAGYAVAGDRYASSPAMYLLAFIPLAIVLIGSMASKASKEYDSASSSREQIRDAETRAAIAEADAREERARAEKKSAQTEAENAELRRKLEEMHLKAVGGQQ